MQYSQFLNTIIESEMVIVKGRWKSFSQVKNKIEGAVYALESCRDRTPKELMELYRETVEYAVMPADDMEHMWFDAYVEEVRFVLDIVSAVMVNEGKKPLLQDQPTYRAVMKASVVLNR